MKDELFHVPYIGYLAVKYFCKFRVSLLCRKNYFHESVTMPHLPLVHMGYSQKEFWSIFWKIFHCQNKPVIQYVQVTVQFPSLSLYTGMKPGTGWQVCIAVEIINGSCVSSPSQCPVVFCIFLL